MNEQIMNKALAPFGFYSSANTGSRNSSIRLLAVSLLLHSSISGLKGGFKSAVQTLLLAVEPRNEGQNALCPFCPGMVDTL